MSPYRFPGVLALALLLVLSGLAALPAAFAAEATPATNAVPSASTSTTATNAAAAPADYRLRAGDVIEVRVYEEDDLNCKPKLDTNGDVALPLIGPVPVGDLTTIEAKAAIRDAYRREYLKDPVVTVSVVEYSRSKVSVLGQVRSPGIYLFPANERLNVLQAIAMAGGYTRIGQPRRVTVKRTVGTAETILRLDAEAMAEREGTRIFEVLPGDVITVGETIF